MNGIPIEDLGGALTNALGTSGECRDGGEGLAEWEH